MITLYTMLKASDAGSYQWSTQEELPHWYTNGHVMVYCEEEGIPSVVKFKDGNKKLEWKIIEMSKLETVPLKEILEKRIESERTDERCENCRGSGECECSHCEMLHTCGDCEGTGKNFKRDSGVRVYVDSKGVESFVDYDYGEFFDGLDVFRALDGSNEKTNTLLGFQDNKIVAIVCPMRIYP